MDSIPISVEVLANVLGTKPGEITDALKDAEDSWKSQSEIDKFLKAGIGDKLKNIRKEGFDEGHGRGTRESLSIKEKELSKKYGVKADNLEALVEQIFDKAKAGSSEGLNDDAIKASEFFQNAVAKLNKKLEAKDEEVQTLQQRIHSEALERELSKLVDSTLGNEEAGFVLPEDSEIRETQKNLYMQQLKSKSWKMTEDGLVPVDDKGKALQDDTYNNISATDLAVSLAKRQFPQAKGKPRSAPQVQTGKPGSGGDNKFTFPDLKTYADVTKHMATLSNVEEINAFEEHVKTIEKNLSS